MDFETLADGAILQELGERLRRARLNRNLTQAQLAESAGIGRRTLQKAEDGEVTTLATLVAILRGLGMLSRLDNLIPEPPSSPVQLARLKGRERRRASGKRRERKGRSDWNWGD